jgi:hypothetical protein
MSSVNSSGQPVIAELVKLGGTFFDEQVNYAVLIDRMSHQIPYYRTYMQHAALKGSYVINNPFTWSADSKFFGTAVINTLGYTTPKTVVLPNKFVECDVTPDTFRNLTYPMDWEAIVNYVGVPAIYKDIHSGGRLFASRVHNVDELLQYYDESGTRTTVLQEVIDSEDHLHAFVIGQKDVLILHYSQSGRTYLPGVVAKDEGVGQQLAEAALKITQVYQYDLNMVEFVVKKDVIYVINGTNPVPDIDKQLMTAEQFNWCVQKTAALAIDRALRPLPQHTPLTNLNQD